MPVQIDNNHFVQFKYHPDYLEGLRNYETPTEVSIKLAKTLTPNSTMSVSAIVADGGNFTFASIKRDRGYTPVAVMKVYPDNIAAKMRHILESCFKVIDLELSDYHELSWAYINMIHTQDVIIVPGLGLSTDMEALEHVRNYQQVTNHTAHLNGFKNSQMRAFYFLKP